VSGNGIGDPGAKDLAANTHVSYNGIGAQYTQSIEERIKCNKAHRLNWQFVAVLISSIKANEDSALKNSIFSLLPGIVALADKSYTPKKSPKLQVASFLLRLVCPLPPHRLVRQMEPMPIIVAKK
jgi:hypothetical protein